MRSRGMLFNALKVLLAAGVVFLCSCPAPAGAALFSDGPAGMMADQTPSADQPAPALPVQPLPVPKLAPMLSPAGKPKPASKASASHASGAAKAGAARILPRDATPHKPGKPEQKQAEAKHNAQAQTSAGSQGVSSTAKPGKSAPGSHQTRVTVVAVQAAHTPARHESAGRIAAAQTPHKLDTRASHAGASGLADPQPASTQTGTGSVKGTLVAVGTGIIFLLKLGFVLALAYLSVAALKLYWSRSGKPLKFGMRSVIIEESAPLSAGAAVHLVRVGSKRWLVGTTQGQINVLARADEEAPAPEPAAAPETLSQLSASQPARVRNRNGLAPGAAKAADRRLNPAALLPESLTPVCGTFMRIAQRAAALLVTTALKPRRQPRSGRPGLVSAAGNLGGELRRSTQFIDEIRTRVASGRED